MPKYKPMNAQYELVKQLIKFEKNNASPVNFDDLARKWTGCPSTSSELSRLADDAYVIHWFSQSGQPPNLKAEIKYSLTPAGREWYRNEKRNRIILFSSVLACVLTVLSILIAIYTAI